MTPWVPDASGFFYEFYVYSPLGPYLRTITRRDLGVRSGGLRMGLTPDRGCLEATFKAVGSILGVEPLQAVQIAGYVNNTPTPLFFGEVRRGGNLRDLITQDYVLRGLDVSFSEVPMVRKSYPEMDANTLLYTAFSDVIAAGGFGTPSLITVDPADFPPLNFTLKVADTWGQPLQALIDRIRQQSAQADLLECKVRPDRSVYSKVKRANDLADVYTLTPYGDPEFGPPVVEKVCTRVLWYVTKRTDTDPATWVTHNSDHPAVADYRPRVVEVQLDQTTTNPMVVAQFVAELSDGVTVEAIPPEDNTLFYADDRAGYYSVIGEADDATIYAEFLLHAPADSMAVRVGWVNGNSVAARVWVYAPDGTQTDVLQATNYGAWSLSNGAVTAPAPGSVAVEGANFKTVMLYNLPAGARVRVEHVGLPTADSIHRRPVLRLYLIKPESVNVGALDAAAAAYWSVPTQEPGKLTTRGLIVPADLQGHVTVAGSTYTRPVESWVYRIEGGSAGGLYTDAMVGNPDEPQAVALAQLIKAGLQRAAIAAVKAV